MPYEGPPHPSDTPLEKQKLEQPLPRLSGKESLKIRDAIDNGLATLDSFRYDKDGKELTLEQTFLELRKMQDENPKIFLPEVERTKACIQKSSSPLLLALEKAHSVRDRANLMLDTIMPEEAKEEDIERKLQEKALNPLVQIEKFKVTRHFINACALMLAGAPDLKEYSGLLQPSSFYKTMQTIKLDPLRTQLKHLKKKRPEAWELINKAVKGQLGLAGEIATSMKLQARKTGMEIKESEELHSDEKPAHPMRVGDEIASWIQMINLLGRVSDPDYILREPATKEAPSPQARAA